MGRAVEVFQNGGTIVGSGATAGNVDHAFMYSGGQMTDLQPYLAVLGLTNSHATAVNDAGSIVGYGNLANGNQHPFLLTAVPEPSALALSSAGVTCLILRRRPRVS
jgi:probable HAF family extracellular repeat protein